MSSEPPEVPERDPPRGRFAPSPATFLRAAVGGLLARRAFSELRTYCMFVGFPRSGHTLVGSLLDAHPEVTIAHELDALAFVRAGYRRGQLLWLLMARSRWFAAQGFSWQGYSYEVPGQWQGRTARPRVIGDKKAAKSTIRLRKQTHLLGDLQSRVGLSLALVNVVRNPFDNIARMALQAGRPPVEVVDRYFGLCEAVRRISADQVVDGFETVRLEALIAAPADVLEGLCSALGVEAGAGYLEACSGIVFPAPQQARDRVAWPADVVKAVETRVGEFEFLEGYRFRD